MCHSSRLILLFLLALIIPSIPALRPAAAPATPTQQQTFNITLLVPTSNSARRAWAAIIQNNLDSLGINATRVELPFSPDIFNRALAPSPSVLGKTYDQGGFDLLFVGYNLGIDADPWSLYHSSQFAPAGQNYYLWNNTQNDLLTSQIKETINKTQRLDLVRQWQVLAADEQPSIPILYTHEIVAFDNSVSNGKAIFTSYHAPSWPPLEHLTTTANASLTLAQTGHAPGEGLIPELSTSYYDTTVSNEIFSSLAIRNDTILKTMIPQLASGTVQAPGWSVTPDGKTWIVRLRPGVTWHDGAPFNATDVKFTLDAIQDDALAPPTEAFVKGILGGKSDVTVVDPMTVKFSLPAPYAYFVENILTYPILPQHILKNIPLNQWVTSLFNKPDTGSGGVPPVGTGPYKWTGYDYVTSTVHLTRNDNYFDFPDKGKAALLSKGQFTVKNYYVRNIVGTDTAITALANGQVNVLDGQYHLETQPAFLSTWGSSRLADYDAFGSQEIGVNMRHPVLGTGVDTPLGRQNPSKAALAARYVRQAISSAIPRQMIIDQLLNGYGNPAITTPVVGNYKTGFAVTEGFNTALQPYSFNLTRSRELLKAAGYFPNQLPVASFTLTPLYPIAGQTIYFDATASYDPDGTITSYAWDFGDVQTSFGATPVHAFASPGTYHVSLTVTDNGSAMTSVTYDVIVTSPIFDFSLSSPSPNSLTVAQGSISPSSSITVTLVSGTTTPVTFSASGLPMGVTATFTNNPCGPTCTATVTFSATATAAIGTVSISIIAFGGGVSHSTRSHWTSLSLNVVAMASTPTSVTCSPSSLNVGRFTTCAVIVTGSSPSGDVTFTTSSSTGAFTPSTATCTLSSGACSATFAPVLAASSSLTVVITASYSGDAKNSPGSGTFSLDVSRPAGSLAIGTTLSTVVNGGVTANQASTGMSVTITGSTAIDGTPVGITTQDLSMLDSGVGTSNLTGPSYYDVVVMGITTGNAQVCISFTSASSSTTMQYWSGTAWTSASNITMNGPTVCGTISVSALTGTNIALGNAVQPVPPVGGNNFLIYIGAGVVATIVLIGVFLVLQRRRSPTRVTA